jgi:hypothetical protein
VWLSATPSVFCATNSFINIKKKNKFDNWDNKTNFAPQISEQAPSWNSL